MPYFVDSLEGNQASVNSYPGKTLRIGRGTNADLRFDDASVALEHAVIEQNETGWTIRARGGSTFIGEDRVGEDRVDARQLSDGDRIDIGVFRLDVEILSTEDPLFLHVARIGEERKSDVGEVSLSTLKTSGGDLLAMVEMADATRRMSTLSETGEPPMGPEDSFITMAASLVFHEGTAAPPAATKAKTTTAQSTAPRTSQGRVPKPIDYAHAYGLERRWLSKSLITTILVLLTAGSLWALFES